LQIVELWRYPVKSVGGERIASARLGETGIEGDRSWGLEDQVTGMILTARRAPELLLASARYEGAGAVSLTLPDGTQTNDDSVLSAWLDRDVRLIAAGTGVGTYETPLDTEAEQDWVSWEGPTGSFHDSTKSRISLVSEATLGAWDLRRFRTNVLLSGAGEDEWVGTAVRLGSEAVLDITKQIDRCVMITRPQPGLDRDLGVLKHINAERASVLSVGALIATGGTVSEGDEVVVVE
jgi:MOSC domain-containing protein